MKAVRWLVPAASLMLVLLLTVWDLRRSGTGPGPLHPAHAAIAELRDGRNCDACHRNGAVDATACNRCHIAIATAAAEHRGLHGSFAADLLQHCEQCHGEHHGDAVALIAPHAFQRVGVADPAHYDHRHFDFHLVGAHAQQPCARCHDRADSATPPEGGRFVGLDQTCTSCHEDAHRGAFGAACETCHGQEAPFVQAPGLTHVRFALQGAHAQVPCASCHAPDTPFDVDAERHETLAVRECNACHANPHDTTAASPTAGSPTVGSPTVGSPVVATALRLPNSADCMRCHGPTQWADAMVDADAHAGYGFLLRGAHATAACAACHGDGAHAARWPEAAPELAACGVCHAQPHGGELLAAATAAIGPAAGCAGCHTDADHDFGAGRISAAQHAATGFALAAPHADVACNQCHVGDERTQRFPGRAAAQCTACHVDAHGGQFAAEPRYAQCTACHEPTHFQPHAFGVATHAASAFPLTGAHDGVACRMCHQEVVDGVRRFRGTPSECTACHRDVHAGAFDRLGRPKQVDGRAGCARCHDTTAFAPVVAAFDHERWTGYELGGAHASVACVACHTVPAGGADADARRLGKAPGTTCSACHADPHAGQFAAPGGTDCSRCHTPTTWPQHHFDHQKQSRFALDATHAALACAKCHVGYAVGERTIVRFKPLGTTCGDCHQLGPKGEVRGGVRR